MGCSVVQVMIELPYIFIQTIIYGVIVYSMIGFEWTVVKLFWHLFFMYFTLLYFTFYGMMTVAVTPNHNIAAITASAFYAVWNLFSGFIIPRTVSENYHYFPILIIIIIILMFIYIYDREFRCGGDGIIIFLRYRGHCMD